MSGIIIVSGNEVIVALGVTVFNTGIFNNEGTFTNDGTIINNAGGNLLNSGTINNFADFTNSGILNNAGDIVNLSTIDVSCGGILLGTVSPNAPVDACAPVATSESVMVDEDEVLAFTLNGTNPDADSDFAGLPLQFSVVSGSTNGSLSGSNANLTYTPNANFSGSDSFTFRVNDVPVADSQNIATNEDTAAGVILAGSDVETGSLTFIVETGPSDGTLSGSAPNLTYTPDGNFSGTDSFTFVTNDGTDNSTAATISLTINAVNDVPVANNQNVSTNEDTAVNITLTGSDVDTGDTLTFAMDVQPENGTLTGTEPGLTYTPVGNFTGTDSFTFVVDDGTVNSATATISITVNAANDAPVANAQSVTTDEDGDVAITLTGSDLEGSTLTFTIVTQPASGTLSGTAPNLTYMPATDFDGADSFTFVANDGTDNSTAATVSITVNPVAEQEDDDDSGGGGGGGGKRVVVVNQEQPNDQSVEVLPESHFADRPLDRIQVSDTEFLGAAGVGISQASVGQQISISSAFSNFQETGQDYVFIVQITDEEGSVVHIGWQQGTVESGQTVELSTSWTPMQDGVYAIQIFVWDGLGVSPAPLSTVAVDDIEVAG